MRRSDKQQSGEGVQTEPRTRTSDFAFTFVFFSGFPVSEAAVSLVDATFLGLSTAADTSESGFLEELGDLVLASDFRSLGFALASGFAFFFGLEPFLGLSSPKESFDGHR